MRLASMIGVERPVGLMWLMCLMCLASLSFGSGCARSGAGAPASAPAPAPAHASAPAQVHRLAFEVYEEDECSQTLASYSTKGTLTLELGADGGAALRLAAEVSDVDVAKDSGESSHGRQRQSLVWRGRAEAEGPVQVVALELAEQRCAWLPAYGDGPETPRPCVGVGGARGRLVLRCAAGSVEATRGADGKEVPPVRHAAWRCAAVDPDFEVAVPGDRMRLPYMLEPLAEAGVLAFPAAPIREHYFRVGYDDSRWFGAVRE